MTVAIATRRLVEVMSVPRGRAVARAGGSEPADLVDERVYKRGALVLHALRARIGDERFFALLRDWAARHRQATVTTEQFVDLAARHAGTDLSAFFSSWLHRPTLPEIAAKGR
jgi:aminopeptidase N